MESSDILLQLKALQQAIQGTNSGNNGYIAQGQNQARQITSPLEKPVYGTEGTAPYVPFAAGTPTLAAQQFDEQTRQNSIANQLSQAKYNLSAAKAVGGGSAKAPKLTVTQKKNDLLGSMTSFVKQKATAGTPYGEAVNIIWDNMDETDRQTLSLSDVQSQVKRVYELNGIDVGSGSGASGAGSGSGIFSGDTAGSGGSGEEAQSYSFTPFIPSATGNFSSPFDQVITGNKETLKNLPWYMR